MSTVAPALSASGHPLPAGTILIDSGHFQTGPVSVGGAKPAGLPIVAAPWLTDLSYTIRYWPAVEHTCALGTDSGAVDEASRAPEWPA